MKLGDGAFHTRLLHVGAVGAMGIALVGLVTGTRNVPPRSPPSMPPEAKSETKPALGYRELRGVRSGANAGMYARAFDPLTAPPEGELPPQSEEDRERALAARAARRAYDGAPPTIPHRIDQQQASSCLVCHGPGARVAGRTAPPMSHEPHASCTQCHVPDVDPQGMEDEPWAGNGFEGLALAGRGERAWPGAPPVIPHPTAMRGRCESCHGPHGRRGLRTTHPERQSCMQCHAPSAVLDQRAVAVAGAPEPAR